MPTTWLSLRQKGEPLKGRLAVCTAVYPGVEAYLPEWHASLVGQTDCDFDLWVGMDGLSPEEVTQATGRTWAANWVNAPTGATPAEVRQGVLEQVVEEYSAVVLVDSDDVLEPERVEAARLGLATADVYGAAMRVVDQRSKDLKVLFDAPGDVYGGMLARVNVYGFSNTAYRAHIMKECMPFPSDAVLLDWYVATRSWMLGATFFFDPMPRMRYRQHDANTARILPPFSKEQISLGTQRVLHHYDLVLSRSAELPALHKGELEEAQERARLFEAATASVDVLEHYIDALDRLPPGQPWWSWVAHPDLEYIWNN